MCQCVYDRYNVLSLPSAQYTSQDLFVISEFLIVIAQYTSLDLIVIVQYTSLDLIVIVHCASLDLDVIALYK